MRIWSSKLHNCNTNARGYADMLWKNVFNKQTTAETKVQISSISKLLSGLLVINYCISSSLGFFFYILKFMKLGCVLQLMAYKNRYNICFPTEMQIIIITLCLQETATAFTNSLQECNYSYIKLLLITTKTFFPALPHQENVKTLYPSTSHPHIQSP